MTPQQLRDHGIDVDRNATIAAYRSAKALDPACCNACATFVLALKTGALNEQLMDLLRALGVDIGKPVEAWGAPDGGFLQVWWPFMGRITARMEPQPEAPVALTGGQEYRITTDYPHPDWPPPQGLDLPAVELSWTGETVRDLERRAWTTATP